MASGEAEFLAKQQAAENIRTLRSLGVALASGLDRVTGAPLPLPIQRLLAELGDTETIQTQLRAPARRRAPDGR